MTYLCRMKKIALTGNFCSGLDKAAEVCATLDIPVFNADLAIKFMLNWREDIQRQIRIQFGFTSTVDGSPIASKFDTAEKFDRLLDVVDVDLFLAWEAFCDRHCYLPIVAYSSHIVYERGIADRFDAVVNIYRPQRMRAHDIASVKAVSYPQALAIAAQEMSEEEKNRMADHVVHNYDRLSMLTQMEAVRQQLASAPPGQAFYANRFVRG